MTLPNFLIIGAAKSATTALWMQLRQHPEVFVAPHKELDFFSSYHHCGLDWHSQLYSSSAEKSPCGAGPR